MGIEGGMTVETKDHEQKQIISRLRRLAGQANSLETVLVLGDSVKFVGQLEAVIAAGRSALSEFARTKLISSDNPDDQKLLLRLIRKS